MKRSVSACGLTALVLTLLVSIIPARGADSFPIPAISIPNTSILPNGKVQPVQTFIGEAWVSNPIVATSVPQNPYMAENPWSCMHNDSYQSDTYPNAGPLGKKPVVSSTWLGTLSDPVAIVVEMTFDGTHNLIIAASIKITSAEGTAGVELTLIDGATLAALARLELPKESFSAGNFRPAGAYFYMNNDNRIVIGTKDRTVWVVSYSYDSGTGKWSFHHDNEADPWDLTNDIPEGDHIEALQPDWSGRLWFTSKGGVVGTLDMTTGEVIDSMRLEGERIVNSHAAGEEGGVYIASTLAMYRFDADPEGAPSITWRKTYDAGTHVKEGQTDIGTGTTPTLMGNKYVTISDNGQPSMHVLVYDRSDGDLVCAVPVFQPGSASNENSLIATEKSIIVENNFGYKSPEKDTTHGRTTKPGIARIDVDEQGACSTVWTNESVSIPSVISKMSLANGLIYTYTKPKGPATTDPWYFTAIDFETGATVYRQLAGLGALYNNHYAGAYLGPDGTLYVGVLGGIVAMRDGE
jgi:hypothetical protein